MTEVDHDIIIAGGGMVGVSLALALKAQLERETRVLLVEGFPLPASNPDFHTGYSPSFDARSTALSYASCLIYRELGIWEELASRACPIQQIHVSDKGRFGSTLMSAADYDWPALGYVIENAWLGNVLIQALHRTQVQTLSPARVSAATDEGDGIRLQLESGDSLTTKLLVVADGAESGLRDGLGVQVSRQDYGQSALIANIGHRKDHGGVAYERFTAQGPLAMLPLPVVPGGGSHSALVWSLSHEESEALMQADEAAFLAELQRRFGYRLGRLERLGERHSYPLALIEAKEQVRRGIVIMGNAAHSLHPVAGQGFNLALRDVARLASELAAAQASGGLIGDLESLQNYFRAQETDQQLTTRFSDQLPDLFMHGDPALGVLRDVGLAALDISPGLKREFVRHTAGVAASAGYRDVQP